MTRSGAPERYLLVAAIKRHIDAHLETESLSVTGLERRFRLSRASLYRLFGADGGLTRYVQERAWSDVAPRSCSV